MNVLVANISTFSRAEKLELEYEVKIPNCQIGKFVARHTNESVLRCLSKMKDIEETGGIGKIIMLVSQKVVGVQDARFDNKTAYTYYKDIVEELNPQTKIVTVPAEEEVHNILQLICGNIEIDDKVYIDSAGGQRNISNVVQLLMKILKYKGIENPYSLYSNINSGTGGVIESTQDFDKMLKLSDAFNEFMTTGKSDQLIVCLRESNSERYKDLVKCTASFSDKIRLGDLDGLDKIINELRNSITSCKQENSIDMESTIVQQFLPIIEDRFFTKEVNVDYCKLIQWCLDNSLIQQALTIYTEKIPITLFDKGYIKYIGGNLDKCIRENKEYANPLKSSDWQTNAFYQDFLSENNQVIEEMRAYILRGKRRESIKNFIFELERVKKYFCDKRSAQIPKKIEKFINRQNIYSYSSFRSAILSNNQMLMLMNGLQSNRNTPTIEKKIQVIKNILKSDNIENNGFKLLMTKENAKRMLFGYIYVKAERNRINHASSDENLNEEQKDIFRELGYDFSVTNLNTIKKNIALSLSVIDDTSCIIEESLKKETENLAVYAQTSHVVGDEVICVCIEKKKVQIEDNPSIPLVIPKELVILPEDVIGKSIVVRIEQISKGRICQVRLLSVSEEKNATAE